MPDLATAPRIRVDRLLDEGDRRHALYDATFWSLRGRPAELPAVWLYDARGSLLFEQITRLPEYYLFRAEREILVAHAGEIAATGARTLVELGSGTSEKTRLLLDALEDGGTLERFVPVDVSEAVLRSSAEAIAARYRTVGVHALVADFERHLAALPDGPDRLIAFLGSTIGNLDGARRRRRLLQTVAAALAPGDSFLLGVDLVKDPARIEAAYNDSRGVTESFVRNGLVAVNRELGADFDQERFGFRAFWDAEHEWMDIGFIARVEQRVAVTELELELALAPGDALRFEISAKFRRELVEAELASAGLVLDAWWTDTAGDFALLLASGT